MRKWLGFIAIAVLAMVLTACVSADQNNVSQQEEQNEQEDQQNVKEDQGEQKATSGEANEVATAGAPIYLNSTLSVEERVADLLGQMSLEEKIGQMLQGERGRVASVDMEELGLGSVLSGGGSYPGKNTIDDWNKMIKKLQEGAMKTEHQIPMVYGADAVHGLALLKGAVVFPHNVGLGAANDPELMYQMGAAVAEEMKLTGILWNFGPCVAVSDDPRWGRTYESYSSDPEIVTVLAEAYLKGQTDHGVASTAKHYVGDGGTTFGTGELNGLVDRGDTRIEEEVFRNTHLLPYKKLVDSGVKIIMASFSSYQGIKMHEHKYLINEVLKGEFGFKGFVVSDWEAMNALSGVSFKEDIALSVNAGVDMLMEPNNFGVAYTAIRDNIEDGSISLERIDDAVSRILRIKFEMGLFEDPYMEQLDKEVTELGSAGYRELAKQLVSKSQVLLKNDNQLLPLKKGQKIFVTGPAMNNMGLQCGGWGLTWQGVMDNGNRKVTEGTTILEGLQEYATTYGLEIITDKDLAKEADVVLLAIGEIPYAEYMGDTTDLSITGALAHPGNTAAITFAESLNKPVITLIVAGRNVVINEYLDQWDSIVMSYLPGSEGDGVASVLFGETPFSGKLAMPYYRSVKDIGVKNAELLFEVGYGLTY